MTARYIIDLTDTEQEELVALTSIGSTKARRIRRARILLLADAGMPSNRIEVATGASSSTVFRVRRRFVEGGLNHAINEGRHPGGTRKLSPTDEAPLVALACSKPPEGRVRWTHRPLGDRLVVVALELHLTPKKASWLNMVELEIGVLVRQCLDRRITDRGRLAHEVAAWERAHNDAGATIRWMFNVEMAREKCARQYPGVVANPDSPIVHAA